ncbi:MAG TPA: hypothetical protein VM912_18050 [Terriglobales bacterium]|nr:hypothetical protein [Terriglobales bacterium]
MIAVQRFLDFRDSISESFPSSDSELAERLEWQLAQLNEQIAHFSRLALQSFDPDAQDRYWILASDISREAYEIRRTLRELKSE